ncbi:MAG: tRNA lysidine(34) synthetase TilS [Proteobacteria bacterium]|nr:tRNA lysidine(34) synthetase TilS [Pseudomonadota bacterium]MBU0966834.1 tRNA lysidine(34) synthetase TilS [Pseudomonadota bacterium]
MEKEILAVIRTAGLVSPGEGVIVGVSGGPDSMALLHVLAALAPTLSIRIIAVYVNHQLRPDEAEKEGHLVEQLACSLGASFATCRIDVKGEAGKRKISIEHAARELRYDFFGQAAEKFLAEKIAVAHTADDQAEEVLLRLIRGTGRTGLSGMKMMRDGKIIRPFLTTDKEELLAYLAEKNISFLTDSSNLQRDYLRNRVRLDLIPYLREFNPNISETLRRTAAVLQDEEVILAALTENYWEQIVTVLPGNTGDGLPVISVELAAFLALDRALQRRIAEKVFITLQSRPQFKKIAQILQVAASGETGARLHFSRGLRMKKGRQHLVFSYPEGKTSSRGDLDDIRQG